MKLAIFITVLVAHAYSAAIHPTFDTSCPMICPMIWMPMCGSDGHTYGNECDLKVSNCLHKTNVVQVHQGSCDLDTLG